MFGCLLFTVLFTVIFVISSTILKLHMGLVLFLDIICSHEFIGGYTHSFISIVQVFHAESLETKTNVPSK